jgi:hypothetical protein
VTDVGRGTNDGACVTDVVHNADVGCGTEDGARVTDVEHAHRKDATRTTRRTTTCTTKRTTARGRSPMRMGYDITSYGGRLREEPGC